ncbi:MAG: D-aminoacyl-tRNA deacylase [Armatimonadota bacterium]
MRAVVQKVKESKVTVDGKVTGIIGSGFLVLLGAAQDDEEKDALYLIDKILNLRVFKDGNDKMNLSCLDVKGEILVVSQFTLLGDVRRGRRPDFTRAADPEKANNLYRFFVDEIKKSGLNVGEGVFAAHMSVELINDGPVTVLLDSKKLF